MSKVCPECGREFENRSVRCPICNCDLEEFIVKGQSGQRLTGQRTQTQQGNQKQTQKISQKQDESKPKETKKGKKKPKTSTIVIIASVLVLIGVLNSNKKDDSVAPSAARDSYEDNSSEQSNEIQYSMGEEDDMPPAGTDIYEIDEAESLTFDEELSKFLEGRYLYITNEDLNKYSPNMTGAKVYIVTDIDDIKNGMIQSTLSGGVMMSNFKIESNYEKYEVGLKNGDLVAICGTVSEFEDYGFMGTSVTLEGCYIFAKGEDAALYKKETSDGALAGYFVVTEQVADSSNDDISEDEYKALCQELDYEDILRNPDSYDGKYCILSGAVDQIIEGWFGSYSIFIKDSSGNKWGCTYSYKDGESHLLAGDYVTVYGKCKGTDTSTTVLGAQVTMPRIDLEYIY